jgi:DNA-binding transcriptional MerR regulator
MTIGEVLSRLRPEFPDVTISKIRFLEEQGLVQPERTPSGYRKFGHADLERLRYILELQRDHYLPLRVIREHLQALDRGQEPALPGLGARAPHLVPDRADLDPAWAGPEAGPATTAETMTRAQLARAADVDEELLRALESYGLLVPRPSGGYDADAAVIARTAGELAAFGIEPRHLRAFRSTAERESGLVEQVVTPLRRQRSDGSAARAEETGREVAALCVRLHAALLKTVLDRGSG